MPDTGRPIESDVVRANNVRYDEHVHEYTAGGLDAGAIVMWSLLNGAIPSGWAECDGVANAPGPDLRDRFIVGRGAKPVDTTGGAATHVHGDNLAHAGTAVANHVFTQPSGHAAHAALATHTHELPIAALGTTPVKSAALFGTGTSRSYTRSITSSSATASVAAALAESRTAGTPDAHSAHAGGAVDAHAVTQPSAHGSHGATNHEPPWYALIYIQKL